MNKKIKKFIALALVAMMLCAVAPVQTIADFFSLQASALDESGQCGENAFWIYDSENESVTISGTGAISASYGGESHEAPFCNDDSIVSVVIESGITAIDPGTFSGCANLVSVELPDTLTSIGSNAFSECVKLSEITIPNGVTTIGSRAFYGCVKMTGVSLPNTLTTLGTCAFSGCTNLGSVAIPGSLTTVSASAFSRCSVLRSVTMSSGVTAIADCAFYNCSRLKSFTIPNTVTTIGASAFYGADFGSLNIPASVTTIGANAFGNNEYLKSVTVDSENPNYSSGDYGELFNKDKTELILWPRGKIKYMYSVPGTVTAICDRAFQYSTYLKSVSIPSSVQTIGESAFAYCTNLEDVTISNGVRTIGSTAFLSCSKIAEITIPYTVTSIGSVAFANSTKFYCYENSAAHTYAQNNNLSYELLEYLTADLLRNTNSTAVINGNNITLTASNPTAQINLYPALTNGASLTFSELSGNVGVSRNGTLYAKNYGTAVLTIDDANVSYNVTFVFPPANQEVADTIRYANATVLFTGSTITLSPIDGTTQISFYPSLSNGTEITFSNLTGGAGLSRNGTLYSKSKGTATATIGSEQFNIIFDFGDEVEFANNIRYANATASVSDTTITLTPAENATQINFYPSLYDGTAVTFSNLTGGAGVSRNGTLYSKSYGTATATIGATNYTVVFDFPAVTVSLADNIRYANATASVSGTTITLTPAENATQINFYPSLYDGTAITFSNLTGGAGVSRSGTLYSKSYGTATATIGQTTYTIVFGFEQPEVTITSLLRVANATVSGSGTTIILTADQNATQINLYPTTTDGKAITFSDFERTGVSRSGTCYAKYCEERNAFCRMTIDGETYDLYFLF